MIFGSFGSATGIPTDYESKANSNQTISNQTISISISNQTISNIKLSDFINSSDISTYRIHCELSYYNSHDQLEVILINHSHRRYYHIECKDVLGNEIIYYDYKNPLGPNEAQEMTIRCVNPNNCEFDGYCVYKFNQNILKFTWNSNKRFCFYASDPILIPDIYFNSERVIHYEIYIDRETKKN
jgi:hypothetical protein